MRAAIAFLALAALATANEDIFLAENPALSPDGKTLVFSWRGDLWSAPSAGGDARRLTLHPARERLPVFSRDGERLAFVSDRTGSDQVYVMPATGGTPRQVTFHTEGSLAYDWFPDSRSLLTRGARDHYWRRAERFFRRRLDDTSAPELLFNGYGSSARLSPDGKQLLFVREGTRWWRKNYVGAQAAQVWHHDLESGKFQRLSAGDHEERWPLWRPSGDGFYFVSQKDGAFNLWRHDLATGQATQLTRYEDDGVLFPALSGDGSTLVFRRLFDLYRMDLAKGTPPERIALRYAGDRIHETERRETLSKATRAAFSADGREVAFIAGGDLWVMDTELREPVRITDTPEEERDPAFAPDFGAIVFVSDAGGQCDLWKAERADPKRHWWQNREFELTRLTNDVAPERNPRFTPDGRIAFTALRGDLWTMAADGTDTVTVLESWDEPSYSFSPDGKWVAYAVDDNDFNRDIWIRPADGSGEAVNISRHPDWDSNPTWSPDGKLLAFTGQRRRDESDIYYVWLAKEDHDQTERDRKIKKALEKMKGRETKEKKDKKGVERAAKSKFPSLAELLGLKPDKDKDKDKKKKDDGPKVRVDFDGIEDRIRRVAIPEASESDLTWSPDSKRLGFRANIDGKDGFYTIELPDKPQPKLLTAAVGDEPRWLEEGKQLVWLRQGIPASVTEKGKETKYAFKVQHGVDLPARHLAAFDLAWRTLRDRWYDERLNNRDWTAVRAKYRPRAARCVTARELELVVAHMLGELNGSHLGFRAREPGWRPEGWRDITWHFGARFDPAWGGPGLKVRDVVEGTPADKASSRLAPGDVVLRADGRELDPKLDVATQLTGPPDRDVVLRVRDAAGKERDVTIRPTTFGAVRVRLYEQWIKSNRERVEKLSQGKLGYLHVRGMSWPSFERFETELYKVGHGRDGLVIDVRNNGGGFTTDHLLTSLTQPVHAVTVPRGGGPGYPQGRMVYARWSKPVVVLCNQNSFSNAEIFSHAIKQLERGRIVGVPTAGGVISTGGTSVMGFAFLRLPFRGWFVEGTGQDMELHGCVPDVVLWPQPGEMPAGTDRQLEKAVELLLEDVKAWRARPRAKLKWKSQR